MNETPVTAIGAIQAILAPALGISAVGLLLLGLLNRYSNMVTRIRLLNDEKRKFKRLLAGPDELEYADRARFASVTKQTEELLLRSRLVRNAILSMQCSIGMFVLALIAILLYHSGHLMGGFLSVDMFFALSGFLITSILLVEWDRTGTIALGAFWARRARRLLPALGFLLGVGIWHTVRRTGAARQRVLRRRVAVMLREARRISEGG